MIFAENNEIVCARKVNVLYIYIDIYKEWIQSRTLTEREEKSQFIISPLLFSPFYLLTVILNTLLCWVFNSCGVILYWDIFISGYFIVILILYLNRNWDPTKKGNQCYVVYDDRNYFKMYEWVSSTSWFFYLVLH